MLCSNFFHDKLSVTSNQRSFLKVFLLNVSHEEMGTTYIVWKYEKKYVLENLYQLENWNLLVIYITVLKLWKVDIAIHITDFKLLINCSILLLMCCFRLVYIAIIKVFCVWWFLCFSSNDVVVNSSNLSLTLTTQN